MKIVFHHEGVLPVKKYGGIERILYWHMVELSKRGHKVILIGHADSEVTHHRIELIPLENKSKEWIHLIPKDSDIIHLQYNCIPDIDIPTINTLHGNGQIGEVFNENTLFVSKRHAEIHGSDQFIYNAIDLKEFPYQERSKSTWEEFMFLAKGSWSVKNLKQAVSACKESKKHLHIAGGKSLWPSKYIHNYGLVDHQQKMEIFSKSDAFLFPIRWPEPFGIAMIEAMSQGLPVIGTKYGSLPELINSEVGILCDNYSDLVDAISLDKNTFNPKVIRAYVEENFGVEKYTDAYLLAYEKVIAGEKINKNKPTYQLSVKAETLLPF
jgi:glycosyltransferase involved in cell wall biosynthesis